MKELCKDCTAWVEGVNKTGLRWEDLEIPQDGFCNRYGLMKYGYESCPEPPVKN